MKIPIIIIASTLLVVSLAYLENIYLDDGNHYHWQNIKKTFK